MQHPYLPHTPQERKKMLDVMGLHDEQELLANIPPSARLEGPLQLSPGLSEMELVKKFRGLAGMNTDLLTHPCFLGAGAYLHHIPAVVDHMAGRSEFYTSYTPYQPEMSQGMLQAIFEFQTMISELCGLPVANASLYDGATAMAEAAIMTLDRPARRKILAARTLHPDYRAVLNTYIRYRPAEVIELPVGDGRLNADSLPLDQETAAVIVGYPNFFGLIEDLRTLAEAVHAAGSHLIVVANPIALGLLETPGKLGADIVVGEGQPLGTPPCYGGPSLGFLSCSDEFLRRVPGRLVGQTTDLSGRRGYVLTLQTREQHIRREKAGSNICSNAALVALRASVYLATLGPEGLARVAGLCADSAHRAMEMITAGGKYKPLFPGPFFHEFALDTPMEPDDLNRALWRDGIIGGLPLGRYYPELGRAVLLTVTEMCDPEDIEKLAHLMEVIA